MVCSIGDGSHQYVNHGNSVKDSVKSKKTPSIVATLSSRICAIATRIFAVIAAIFRSPDSSKSPLYTSTIHCVTPNSNVEDVVSPFFKSSGCDQESVELGTGSGSELEKQKRESKGNDLEVLDPILEQNLTSPIHAENPEVSQAHILEILGHGEDIRNETGIFKEKLDLVRSFGVSKDEYFPLAYAATIQQISVNIGIDEEIVLKIINGGASLQVSKEQQDLGAASSEQILDQAKGFISDQEMLSPAEEMINLVSSGIQDDLGIGFENQTENIRSLVALGALAGMKKEPYQEANIEEQVAKLKIDNPRWTKELVKSVLDQGSFIVESIQSSSLETRNRTAMADELNDFLGGLGLRMEKILDDGNCFFRAIAVAEGKSEDTYGEYREAVTAQLITDGATEDEIDHASTDRVYAESREVEALSKAISRPIVIVMWRGQLDRELPPKTADTKLAFVNKVGFEDPNILGKPIFITLAANHYNVIVGKNLEALLD